MQFRRFRETIFLTYLGLAILSLVACSENPESALVRRVDSAGVEIIHSSGVDRMLDWEFDRQFVLGGAEEGPEAFYTLYGRYIGVDGKGNLYVLDPSNHRVVVFTPDGQYVRSVGSRGEGPGEFETVGSFWVGPDGSVAVFDFGKAALVWFDPSGEPVDQEAFRHYPTPNDQRHFARLDDVTFVSKTIFGGGEDGPREILQSVTDADTVQLAEARIPPIEMAMFPQCGGGLRLPPLFTTELKWDVRSEIMVVSASPVYSVSVLENGEVSRIVRRELPVQAATRELAIAHLGDGVTFNFGHGPCVIDAAEMAEKRGFAEVVPQIQSVLLGPTGELWVRRFVIGKDSLGPVDVFDEGGVYQGTISLPSLNPVLLLPNDRFAAIDKDELDIERLVVLAIRK